jgi:glutamine amidotransferase
MDAQISTHLSDPRAAAARLDVVVVNYEMGNLRSVVHALEFLGCRPRVSGDPNAFERCDAIVLPGVGAFGEAMANLSRQKLIKPLTASVLSRNTPFLGICLGMQLLARESEEYGRHEGLGWIDAVVRNIPATADRVPHVGWSPVRAGADDPLFQGIEPESSFYFDHSLHVVTVDAARLATIDHGGAMVAALSRDELYATQFHPEKSQRTGLKLLRNFLNQAIRCSNVVADR